MNQVFEGDIVAHKEWKWIESEYCSLARIEFLESQGRSLEAIQLAIAMNAYPLSIKLQLKSGKLELAKKQIMELDNSNILFQTATEILSINESISFFASWKALQIEKKPPQKITNSHKITVGTNSKLDVSRIIKWMFKSFILGQTEKVETFPPLQSLAAEKVSFLLLNQAPSKVKTLFSIFKLIQFYFYNKTNEFFFVYPDSIIQHIIPDLTIGICTQNIQDKQDLFILGRTCKEKQKYKAAFHFWLKSTYAPLKELIQVFFNLIFFYSYFDSFYSLFQGCN